MDDSGGAKDQTQVMWEIPVLYEDEFILAVDKPAGLMTQSGQGSAKADLFSLLEKQRKEKLFLHHRLDKETSGVLILGRHTRANKGLTDIFRDHLLTKTYWAVTKKNESPTESRVLVQNLLAPVRGPDKRLLRMVTVKKGGWPAETQLRLLKDKQELQLWEAQPKTGRTHQVRVHLAGIRRPILGDFLYGGKSPLTPRLLLHAKCLEFKHPVTGQDLKIEAPVPADFQKWID